MANDNISVSGPITVAQDSHERVAFELMQHIADNEHPSDEQRRSRTYWLTLYHQCHLASKGMSLEHVLQVK
ncbi:MAG TPA: hypothetical protein VFW53_06640 [Gallionella sp.]|nr:hypothetical protein [Gallionella sp.]